MSASCLPLAALVLSLLACAGDRVTLEPDPLRRPVVERLSEQRVRIRWPAAFATGTVSVFAGRSAEAIERSHPLAVAAGGSVILRGPEVDASQRLYYELVPASGAPVRVTAERRLPLEGADNFRDLGGYATNDGRHVAWGRLYRSNDLSQLSDRDLAYLAGLGLRLVCDFRADAEREAAPDRPLAPEPPQVLQRPVELAGLEPGFLRDRIRAGGIAELAMERTMRASYISFVWDHAKAWAALFERLAARERLPALVHCTGGKDRTGFAAALVLLALGVSEEAVFEDYLLTNHYQESFRRSVLRWVPLYSLFRTEAADLLPLLEARRAYLQASLDAIVERHGSVEGYLEDGLGITPKRRQALRASLLR